MRIAALSDIHSNVFALDAVIRDAKGRGVELMLNLGDICYGPIAPRATYDLLNEHDFVTISGNQDRQIHEATGKELEANPTMRFVSEDLGPAPISWLKSLPFDRQLDDEVYLCHGSPTDDTAYLLEDVESGHARLRSDPEIVALLDGQRSGVILCGHTHTARTVALSTGQVVVNPGSVGLPAYTDDEPVVHSMESFSRHAAYSMLERGVSGWTIQNILVPYDDRKAAAAAKNQGREDWACFLTTGRGLKQP